MSSPAEGIPSLEITTFSQKWNEKWKQFWSYFPKPWNLPMFLGIALFFCSLLVLVLWIPFKVAADNEIQFNGHIKNISSLQISEPEFGVFIFVSKWQVEIDSIQFQGTIQEKFGSSKQQEERLKQYSINSIQKCFKISNDLSWNKTELLDGVILILFLIIFIPCALCFLICIIRYVYVKIKSR